MVARHGFEAMMKGEGDVVTGWQNKLQLGDRQCHALGHAGGDASQNGGAAPLRGLRAGRSAMADDQEARPADGERDASRRFDPVTENIETILRLEDAELQRRTWSDTLADAIAEFTGSMPFVVLHLAWFGAWAVWNTGLLPFGRPFDPFPYQLLAVIVSLEGVLLVTFVLIKQNRMAYLSDRRAHLDLQINLLAEREVTHVLRLLQRVAERLEVRDEADAAHLTDDTRVEGLMNTLDRKLNSDC